MLKTAQFTQWENWQIGQKPTSNPKSKISNWTGKNADGSLQTACSPKQCNLQFLISDLRWAFVQFPDSFSPWPGLIRSIEALCRQTTSCLDSRLTLPTS